MAIYLKWLYILNILNGYIFKKSGGYFLWRRVSNKALFSSHRIPGMKALFIGHRNHGALLIGQQLIEVHVEQAI